MKRMFSAFLVMALFSIGGWATNSSGRFVIGSSVNGTPIVAYRYGSGEDLVLYFAAIHGDEPQSAYVVERFRAFLEGHPEYLEGRSVIIVPRVNPDGLELHTRKNAHEVDINRNFPASNWWKGKKKSKKEKDWGGPSAGSEPETKALMQLLDQKPPSRIISIHYPQHCVNYDPKDAKDLAQVMARKNGYEVCAYIGYDTPGSFGTYAGIDGHIPTITLELGPFSNEKLWEQNKHALLAALLYPDVQGHLREKGLLKEAVSFEGDKKRPGN